MRNRIVQCLQFLRIHQSVLPPHLIHNPHNHHALLPTQRLALQLPLLDAPCHLIRLVHEPPSPTRHLHHVLFHQTPPLALRRHRRVPHDPPRRRPVRRVVHLDLALGALDADGGARAAAPVRVGGHAQVRGCDAVGVRRAGGAGWEGEEDGGHLVGARLGVFGDEALDGRRGLALRGGEGVVEGLEDPG